MSSRTVASTRVVAFVALLAIGIANSAPAQTLAKWTISSSPTLVLSPDGSPRTEFFGIRAAWRLTDGSLAVVNGGTNQIRVFDSHGSYRYSFGRAGEGPGEFRNMTWGARRGDTAVIYDADLRRVTSVLLGAKSRSIASLSINPQADANFNGVVGRLADGRWLVRSFERPDISARGFQRTLGSIGAMSASGTGSIEWLAKLPDMAIFVTGSPATGVDVSVAAFAPRLAMLASGPTIWIGDTAGDSLLMIDQASKTRRFIKLPDRPMPLEKARVDAARARELSSAPDDGQRARTLARYEATNLPARSPAFAGLVGGPEGEVWVERIALSQAPQVRYLVLSGRGVPIGTVETVSGFRVTDVGHDYVVGIHRDEDGVETVRMYSLHR